MSGQTSAIVYKPGDKALILFGDGEWRAAELSQGFIWATPDGSRWLAAEGGFDARPLLTTATPPADPMLNIGDTCCGQCPGGTCYVDEVTGA